MKAALILCLLTGCAAHITHLPGKVSVIRIEHVGGVREIEVVGARVITVNPAENCEVKIKEKRDD